MGATPNRKSWATRLLAEFLVISAGVLMALAADDWRQDRALAREAQEIIELLVDDLAADSLQYVAVGRASTRQASAAAWLIEGWDRTDHSPDSVESALYEFSVGSRFKPRRSAYEGLRDVNRLRLVSNASLRAAITSYYQGFQSEVFRYDSESTSFTYDLNDRILHPHVRHLGGERPGVLWPPRERRVELRRPWVQTSQDTQLHARLVWLGRFEQYLADLCKQGEEETGRLLAELRASVRRE